jgi:hypothetical protein
MHLRGLTITSAVLLQACAQIPSTVNDADTWAILSPKAKVVAIVGGSWTPSAEQVFAARETARQRIIADAQTRGATGNDKWRVDNAHEILKNWPSYRLQAYGHTDHHKQLIRLSFITLDKDDDGGWRSDLYVVSDGGAAYWQADYDPSSGKIIWWEANGVA